MSKLPCAGKVDCTACFQNQAVDFDRTKTGENGWRITSNPLAWGNPEPEVVVLGFSKGPTQAGALSMIPHNEIAYKGSRRNVGKILAHIGLMDKASPENLKQEVDKAISDTNGRFHFGSLVRCTVERLDEKDGKWKGSGGGMLDKFVRTPFGDNVAKTCSTQFLSDLPETTRLIVMFGLGTKCNYVRSAFELFKKVRPGKWRHVNDVAYSDGKVTVVHVEHFASQGALIPNWLGENDHPRKLLGKAAQDASKMALG